jgi:hypothetical protein
MNRKHAGAHLARDCVSHDATKSLAYRVRFYPTSALDEE